MESVLMRRRSDQNRREQRVSEEFGRQIEILRIDHQSRPEHDAIETVTIAAGDRLESGSIEFAPCQGLELEAVDEFVERRDAAWGFANDLRRPLCSQ